MQILNSKKIMGNSKSTTGFAMLFAVLTASLLLTVGISIFNISLKELTISTNSRESQVAFFAADSARECALYWDIKKGAFDACLTQGCSSIERTGTSVGLNEVTCNGLADTLVASAGSLGVITYTQESLKPSFIKYSNSNLDPEAHVIVTKSYSNQNITTIISATGHNTGVPGRRLERAIEQTSI